MGKGTPAVTIAASALVAAGVHARIAQTSDIHARGEGQALRFVRMSRVSGVSDLRIVTLIPATVVGVPYDWWR
jgi:hypothetical protein